MGQSARLSRLGIDGRDLPPGVAGVALRVVIWTLYVKLAILAIAAPVALVYLLTKAI